MGRHPHGSGDPGLRSVEEVYSMSRRIPVHRHMKTENNIETLKITEFKKKLHSTAGFSHPIWNSEASKASSSTECATPNRVIVDKSNSLYILCHVAVL